MEGVMVGGRERSSPAPSSRTNYSLMDSGRVLDPGDGAVIGFRDGE